MPGYGVLSKDYRLLVQRKYNIIQVVEFTHTLREANTVADILSKKGQDLPVGLHLLDTAPPDTLYALAMDVSSLFRIRGV
ncbi:hypothetical protein AHAS_Ahas19G0074300 [Arachis hypogaea]